LERKHRVPKRYATELKNIPKRASTYLLSEVVCHHLASLASFEFNFDVGFVHGRAAPKKTRQLILSSLELNDEGQHIMVAQCARFNQLATCQQRDVVLLRNGDSFTAGRVQLHFDIEGECMCLVQPFALHRRSPGTALAVWRPEDGPLDVWDTSRILAAVEFCVYPDGNFGTILPIEHA
jgi:hypothetical protein